MPYQIMNIGPGPSEEKLAQVGNPDYEKRSRRECQVFKRMLARLYPIPADAQADLIIKSFAHDFGAYREVCVRYSDNDAVASNYAFDLERHMPAEWDAIARFELLWSERLAAFNRAVCKGELRQEEIPALFRRERLPTLPSDQTFEQLLAAFPI